MRSANSRKFVKKQHRCSNEPQATMDCNAIAPGHRHTKSPWCSSNSTAQSNLSSTLAILYFNFNAKHELGLQPQQQHGRSHSNVLCKHRVAKQQNHQSTQEHHKTMQKRWHLSSNTRPSDPSMVRERCETVYCRGQTLPIGSTRFRASAVFQKRISCKTSKKVSWIAQTK